jgi:hypothetical protein
LAALAWPERLEPERLEPERLEPERLEPERLELGRSEPVRPASPPVPVPPVPVPPVPPVAQAVSRASRPRTREGVADDGTEAGMGSVMVRERSQTVVASVLPP